MIATDGYAAAHAKAPLTPYQFQRRAPRAHDVQITITHCGICHSDLHQLRGEWNDRGIFPMVAGHEIIGIVEAVGADVQEFAVGDRVGVGCMVDSCRKCASCDQGLEQYCERGFSPTYNGLEQDKKTPTYGGYSRSIVVDESFVLHVPKQLDPAGAAPLLCAGITTFSPLKHWKIGKGDKVGIVGLGGLGHVAIKLARALGAEVTLFTTSPRKREDAQRLGAHHVIVSTDRDQLKKARGQLDFILNTVAAPHDLDTLLRCLKLDGTMVLVGLPDTKHPAMDVGNLIAIRRNLAGSMIGGIAETQEMLDFCGHHNITADIESIALSEVNEALDRLARNDVRYRFVIEMGR